MRLPGFEERRCGVGETSYYLAVGGEGPPLLLLHGFPETHLCWEATAPALARDHSVVAPDLRGYGASRAPAGGARGEGYTKREMAAELVELMSALAADPAAILEHAFDTWSGDPAAIGPEHRRAYLEAMTEPAIAAMCADYRASFHLDRVHEADDREAGRPLHPGGVARRADGGPGGVPRLSRAQSTSISPPRSGTTTRRLRRARSPSGRDGRILSSAATRSTSRSS
ncbi:MAG TPA: alpha/beta fold hydrolase, partial [Thermoleophilaceae bacterium]